MTRHTHVAEPALDHLDADLIRLCAQHAVNREVYNRNGIQLDPKDDPLFAAYARTRDAISAAKPTTLEGMLAKARAAKAEAREPYGSEEPAHCPAADWAWDLVGDLLRLHAAEEARAADADLIRLCDRLADIERQRAPLSRCDTPEEEDAAAPALAALDAEWDAAWNALYSLSPTTREGAIAMSRAALAIAPRHSDGRVICAGCADALAFDVVTFLADGAQA